LILRSWSGSCTGGLIDGWGTLSGEVKDVGIKVSGYAEKGSLKKGVLHTASHQERFRTIEQLEEKLLEIAGRGLAPNSIQHSAEIPSMMNLAVLLSRDPTRHLWEC